MLQAQKPAVKSPAVVIRSMDLKEKINLLEENVESLLNQDRNITEEIKEVKSNFATVKAGLTNQIQQISVSCKAWKFSPLSYKKMVHVKNGANESVYLETNLL